MMRWLSVFCLLTLLGCDSNERSCAPTKQVSGAISHDDQAHDFAGISQAPAAEATVESSPTDSGPSNVPPAKALQRKIVYTAQVRLVVEDFTDVPKRVEQLAAEHGGYVASSTISGSSGSPRSGHWKLRVPVDQYDPFRNSAIALGEVRSTSSNARDVSEEFYDVQARIRNKKKAEERLLSHLEKSTGKLNEILQVENELQRVRGEIERMEGRMRVLEDLTAMTTIDLSIEEIRGYVPEQAPTFSTRVARAFFGSWGGLVIAAENFVIFLARIVLWVPLFLLAGWLFVKLGKRVLRRGA